MCFQITVHDQRAVHGKRAMRRIFLLDVCVSQDPAEVASRIIKRLHIRCERLAVVGGTFTKSARKFPA
ncbi:hypothetical protein WS63_03415 [Burkholderia stagnalis]|uniref:hypothetical protein n=1 Tax=Burkholderia stagnalis TaxID=1503054 RepID=UPI000756B6BE|nr:hypothetical protein [Burkholderia stagnalis]KVD94697.1 hypothetical protein WS63_03415 [Burkholderia stagnalis]KVL93064.1 hypothetical protein WT03_18830 [Burkholderia stagnalis]KVL94761.1 hypothetical protein WT02_18000 [Burkholderia stagnalis]KVM13094.1 hypothetical protein WT04_11320 [Burkholderia stagnalis]